MVSGHGSLPSYRVSFCSLGPLGLLRSLRTAFLLRAAINKAPSAHDLIPAPIIALSILIFS